MPKIIAVVGGKRSGKTTVIRHLIPKLKSRGYRVGSVKEMLKVKSVYVPNRDTWEHKAGAETIISTSLNETVVFIEKKLNLNELLSFFDGFDHVVLEGFEEEKTIPKIIAAKDAREAEVFSDGLAIAISGIITGSGEEMKKASGLQIPIVDCETEAEKLADIVEQKAFPKLLSTDCGDCGYGSCYELAKAIVTGKAKPESCHGLEEDVFIEIDGCRVPLTRPFAREIIKNTIVSLVSSLRGVKKVREVKITVRKGQP